jgi:hypothetical protein
MIDIEIASDRSACVTAGESARVVHVQLDGADAVIRELIAQRLIALVTVVGSLCQDIRQRLS